MNMTSKEWSVLISRLEIRGFARALIDRCKFKEMKGNWIYLSLPKRLCALHTPNLNLVIADELAKHFGKIIELKISHDL